MLVGAPREEVSAPGHCCRVPVSARRHSDWTQPLNVVQKGLAFHIAAPQLPSLPEPARQQPPCHGDLVSG